MAAANDRRSARHHLDASVPNDVTDIAFSSTRACSARFSSVRRPTLQQAMQVLDIVNPGARATTNQLGQIGERRGPEFDQVLALQVASRPRAGRGGDALRAMLRENRAGTRLGLPHVFRPIATGDDPDAIEIERARQADGLRRHRVRMAIVHDDPGRAHTNRHSQREIRRDDSQRPQPRAFLGEAHHRRHPPWRAPAAPFSPSSATRAAAARDPPDRGSVAA